MDNSSIFNNRNFLLLFSGNAASHIGLQGVRLAYPLLTLVLTGSPFSASLVTFAMTLPGLIFELPAGAASDYWDRRRVLIMCQRVGLAATLLATAVIAMQPPGLLLFLAVAAFAEGTAYVFFNSSELGLVRDIVTVAERPAAFAFLEAEQPLANMVGRMFGSAAFGIARSLPFLANAVSYMYCLWTLSRMRTRAPVRPDANGPKPARIWGLNYAWAGVRIIWDEPFMRRSTIIIGATNLIIQILMLTITVEVRDSGHSAWIIGAVLSASGVGGLLGTIPAARLANRLNPRIAMTGMVWAWIALCVLMAVSSNVVMLSIGWAGIGFFGTIGNVVLLLYRVHVFPEDLVGRVYGATKIITHGGTAVGTLLAGGLLSVLGASITGWISIAGMVFVARYARRLPEPRLFAPTRAPSTEPPTNWIARQSNPPVRRQPMPARPRSTTIRKTIGQQPQRQRLR